ncbi:oligo-1,6-glucosidase [Halorubrum xinjiangense]|uniref:Oligo-1,6-glucosidase n=1 Tax=Halorubrum xinjiangense TaxID=261291 RepID=A0A1G7LU33_9EURY|nr:alpha-glucosidase [Halorubrum xinjiangense]SDF53078.1 oligo-1,6-glucosidase [Halorubrum xinjiangense]
MTSGGDVTDPDRSWWKESVVYQVYPRSFNDSDGDGIGDLRGITQKADYLDELGIDVVWLCPVYDSPQEDNGYDIRDYRAIDSEFGTMADWEALRTALHDRDIRLVMDLVVNHTSAEHEWFQRSRREKAGYEDYYHWREGSPDEPPNNWESFFGGSAWSYDDERGAWYLHLFHENQPDLNWRSPRVRGSVTEMIQWWLDKDIDGFRMDALNLLSKPAGYPDGDPDADVVGEEHFFNGPRLEEYLGEIVATTAGHDVMTVAEMSHTDVDTAASYLGDDGVGLGMLFQSAHMEVDAGAEGVWDPSGPREFDLPTFKRVMDRWQEGLWGRGWNAVFLGNHDQPRIVSRFGDDGEYRRESAKLLATFLLTLSGTPYVYQGDEIGMTNAEFESLDEIDDVETIGSVEELRRRDGVDSFADVADLVNYWSRDHARTPMQWSDGAHAGFTDGEPWFPVTDDYGEINVEKERSREDSVWHYYRRLIELRHEEDALVYGEYDLLLPDHPSIYAYTRTLDGDRLFIVLNWSDEAATFEPDAIEPDAIESAAVETLAGNYDESPTDPTGSAFRPYEAAVYRL